MTIEIALDKAKSILTTANELGDTLTLIDAETVSPALITPSPRGFLIGSYLGREEVLAEIPAVTFEARTTVPVASQEEWREDRHTVWVWAFVAEVDIEQLHRFAMRYGEALKRILRQRNLWGGGWHNVEVGNAIYTNVFWAGHRLLQGCRVEVSVSEVVREVMA